MRVLVSVLLMACFADLWAEPKSHQPAIANDSRHPKAAQSDPAVELEEIVVKLKEFREIRIQVPQKIVQAMNDVGAKFLNRKPEIAPGDAGQDLGSFTQSLLDTARSQKDPKDPNKVANPSIQDLDKPRLKWLSPEVQRELLALLRPYLFSEADQIKLGAALRTYLQGVGSDWTPSDPKWQQARDLLIERMPPKMIDHLLLNNNSTSMHALQAYQGVARGTLQEIAPDNLFEIRNTAYVKEAPAHLREPIQREIRRRVEHPATQFLAERGVPFRYALSYLQDPWDPVKRKLTKKLTIGGEHALVESSEYFGKFSLEELENVQREFEDTLRFKSKEIGVPELYADWLRRIKIIRGASNYQSPAKAQYLRPEEKQIFDYYQDSRRRYLEYQAKLDEVVPKPLNKLVPVRPIQGGLGSFKTDPKKLEAARAEVLQQTRGKYALGDLVYWAHQSSRSNLARAEFEQRLRLFSNPVTGGYALDLRNPYVTGGEILRVIFPSTGNLAEAFLQVHKECGNKLNERVPLSYDYFLDPSNRDKPTKVLRMEPRGWISSSYEIIESNE